MIRIWDTFTGVLRTTLQGHAGAVIKVVFSPDGRNLASASRDKTVRIWNPFTGVLWATLEGHSNRVDAVVFSPDGQYLASRSHGDTIKIWDPLSGVLWATLEGHSAAVTAVVFPLVGQYVASGSDDNAVRIWDPLSGILRAILKGNSATVTAMILSPDGQVLASGFYHDVVRIWDIGTIGIIQQIRHVYNNYISFSEDGSQLKLDGRLINLPSSSSRIHSYEQISLDSDEKWVLYRGAKVLWLPPGRRPYNFALRDNILVLGDVSDRMTFLRFSTTHAPFEHLPKR